MIGLYLLCWPLYSIYRKINYLLRWRDWILSELPKVIALIPTIIQALKKGFNEQADQGKPDTHTSEY